MAEGCSAPLCCCALHIHGGGRLLLTHPAASGPEPQSAAQGGVLPLNTSQPLLHTVGSAQKPLELPCPSLFLLSAQWPQTIHRDTADASDVG